MTGPRSPEDGETDRQRFVDPLTGQPLLPAPPAEPPAAAAPPAGDPRALGSTTRVVLTVTGVAVLVIVLGVVAVIGHFDDLAEPSGPASAELPTSAVRARLSISPVVAGWQPVISDEHPFAFDVPANWHVETPDVTVGFQDQNGELLLLHGVGRFKNNFCPSLDVSSRAQAGFTTIGAGEVEDPPDAARETVSRWAEAAYGSADGPVRPQVDVTAAQPAAVFAGTVEASRVTATVRPVEPTACSPPSVTITAVALPLRVDPGAGQYHVHVTLCDQQVEDAVAPEVTDKIIESIRQVD